jgi:hypothetical protein
LKIASGRTNAGCATCDGTGGGTAGFQPVMYPDSEANRKAAGPELVPDDTTNPAEVLNTSPVGDPPAIETVRGIWVTGVSPTAPVYRVDTSVPLSATHAAPPVGGMASPTG